jgi:hypothetical protein
MSAGISALDAQNRSFTMESEGFGLRGETGECPGFRLFSAVNGIKLPLLINADCFASSSQQIIVR